MWLSKHTHELTTNESLIFASLISAIDPVATIVTMQSIGVGGKLYALIFGEAVLNDAVAIVINQVFVAVAERDKDLGESMAIAVPVIIGVSIASILIGCAFALFAALLFKKTNLRNNHVLECGCFYVLSFLPYLISELLGLSGI